MSILVKIVDSRQNIATKPFLSANNTITQIYLCTVVKDA